MEKLVQKRCLLAPLDDSIVTDFLHWHQSIHLCVFAIGFFLHIHPSQLGRRQQREAMPMIGVPNGWPRQVAPLKKDSKVRIAIWLFPVAVSTCRDLRSSTFWSISPKGLYISNAGNGEVMARKNSKIPCYADLWVLARTLFTCSDALLKPWSKRRAAKSPPARNPGDLIKVATISHRYWILVWE